MSQQLSNPSKGQVSTMPTTQQPSKKEATILNIDAVEVPQRPTIHQVFQKLQEGIAMQELHEKISNRLKELIEFERFASEETGFVLTASLAKGKKIEFNHLPSNIEFVRHQVAKGKQMLEELENQIQNF